MISVRHLKKSYGKKKIFDDFNYAFQAKHLYLLVGESGVGKTTLLNIISGVDKDYLGEIISSEEVFYYKSEYLIGEFTVKENIEFIEDIIPGFKLKKDNYGISELYEKKVNTLSGGEKQRLCFYISMCSNMKNILLDEPTAHLDYSNKKNIVKAIEKESQNKTLIVVTHEKELFNNYSLLELNGNKCDYDFAINIEITDKYVPLKQCKNLSKWGVILIKKNFMCFLIFIVSTFSLVFFLDSFKQEINIIEEAFYDSYSEGKLFYKDNDLNLNDEYFYKEVVLALASEIEYYGSSIYSKDMYEHKVYLDSYYYGNGFVFSSIYQGVNLTENEVLVGVDFQKICINNKMEYCNEMIIKESLIGKELKYIGNDIYTYKIKGVIDGEDALYFGDTLKVKNELLKEYNSYDNAYYIIINKKHHNSYMNKINNIDSLLKYDFIEYYSDENCRYYMVKKADTQYFSYLELDENDLVGCGEYGVNCNSFSFSIMNSLYYIEDVEVGGKIKFQKHDNVGEKEIIVSSSLLKMVNVEKGDMIKLKYYIDKEIYIEELKIISVIENEELVIYKDNSYSYEFLFNLTGKDHRVKYAYGDVDRYKSHGLLYSDLIKETQEIMNAFTFIVYIVIYSLYLIVISLLFFIEYKRNAKYKKLFNILKNNNIKGGNQIFYIFYIFYTLCFIFIAFISTIFSLLYLLIEIIFVFVSKRKIQVSLD